MSAISTQVYAVMHATVVPHPDGGDYLGLELRPGLYASVTPEGTVSSQPHLQAFERFRREGGFAVTDRGPDWPGPDWAFVLMG